MHTLGGKATAAEVGTVCGLYKFNKKTEPEYIVKGFAKEFAEALQTKSKSKPLHNTDGLALFTIPILKRLKKSALDLLHENKITVYFNSVLKTV